MLARSSAITTAADHRTRESALRTCGRPRCRTNRWGGTLTARRRRTGRARASAAHRLPKATQPRRGAPSGNCGGRMIRPTPLPWPTPRRLLPRRWSCSAVHSRPHRCARAHTFAPAQGRARVHSHQHWCLSPAACITQHVSLVQVRYLGKCLGVKDDATLDLVIKMVKASARCVDGVWVGWWWWWWWW